MSLIELEVFGLQQLAHELDVFEVEAFELQFWTLCKAKLAECWPYAHPKQCQQHPNKAIINLSSENTCSFEETPKTAR